MKRIGILFILFVLISCSEWDRAAVGNFTSKEVNSSINLSLDFKSRLEYKGKLYKGKWNTDSGKDANVIYLYFGDTIITGVIREINCNCIEIENDNFFDSKSNTLTFKKEKG